MPEEERKRPRRRRAKTISGVVVAAGSVAGKSGRIGAPKAAALVSTTSPGSTMPTPAPSHDPSIQRQAFFMRANAVPVDEVAEVLGITESEAATAIYEYANRLNNSEVNSTEIARRLQLEQLDMALRSLMPHVSGTTVTGDVVPVNLDVMDKFLKIMDQKAKLTGINAPQRVDLSVRLRKIAEETGEFEYEDLEEILKDVIRDFPQLGVGSGG